MTISEIYKTFTIFGEHNAHKLVSRVVVRRTYPTLAEGVRTFRCVAS